jgi:hypothetical protein
MDKIDTIVYFDDALARVLDNLVKATTSSDIRDDGRAFEADIVLPSIAESYA